MKIKAVPLNKTWQATGMPGKKIPLRWEQNTTTT